LLQKVLHKAKSSGWQVVPQHILFASAPSAQLHWQPAAVAMLDTNNVDPIMTSPNVLTSRNDFVIFINMFILLQFVISNYSLFKLLFYKQG
jgi:hypothetical protein